MADSPVTLLRAHARYAPWNSRGLAAHATALVDAAGVRPTNSSARAILTPRAVRFYVTIGLLDHPEGAGTAATYQYRHLLQLLAIKIRQRDGQSLETIRKEMRDVAGDVLERSVATSMGMALGAKSDQVVAQDDSHMYSWRRVAVAEGVEIHVRDDSPVARDSTIAAMREAVRTALGRIDAR